MQGGMSRSRMFLIKPPAVWTQARCAVNRWWKPPLAKASGTTFSGLGRYPEAEKEYRAALALRRSGSGKP